MKGQFMLRRAHLFSTALFLAAPAGATTVNGPYSFSILQQDRAIQQGERYEQSVVLPDGSVVTLVRAGRLGSSPAGPDRIEVVAPDGATRIFTAPPRVRLSGTGSTLSANSAGQITINAFINSGRDIATQRSELWLIEPDDTVRVLVSTPRIQPPNVADPVLIDFRTVRLNEAGEVAAFGTARDAGGLGLSRVVKLSDTSAATPTVSILDTAQPRVSTLADGIAIDDSGQVSWARQQGGVNTLLLSDGTTERVAIQSSGPRPELYIASELTEGGVLAVRQSGQGTSLGTSDTTDAAVIDDFTQAFAASGSGGWDLNEFGQYIYREGLNRGDIFVDGARIIGTQDAIGGFDLDRASNGVLRTNTGQFINDSGQFVFDGRGFTDEGIFNLTVRADPMGATPDNPILPSGEVGGVTQVSYGIVNALGLEGGNAIFVDPIFGSGLSYEITNGGPNFMSLLVPMQDLGGLDMFEVSFGGVWQTLGFGETLDFTDFAPGGVSSFSIFGKDGAKAFGSDFVAGFTHAGLGRVELAISAAVRPPNVIPLPASVLLLLAGLAGLLGLKRAAGRA